MEKVTRGRNGRRRIRVAISEEKISFNRALHSRNEVRAVGEEFRET